MKTNYMKGVIFLIAFVCIMLFPVQPVSATQQGTDGSELQVEQAQHLEIQLGEDWAGTAFQLKTDSGLYPGDILVDTDGVLRLEIGGSQSYILSCLNLNLTPSETDETQPEEDKTDTKHLASVEIPKTTLILFGGGLIVAVITLVGAHFLSRRDAEDAEYDEYDDDEI